MKYLNVDELEKYLNLKIDTVNEDLDHVIDPLQKIYLEGMKNGVFQALEYSKSNVKESVIDF